MKLAYRKLCYKNLIMHSIPYKFQLSTLDLNLWRKEVVLHKRGLLKDTSLLFQIYLHPCVVELLYKPNITLVDVRYGCISHCSAYIRITAVRYTA